MKKFSLKLADLLAIIVVCMLLVFLLCPAPAQARDLGPQKAVSTVTTNSASVSIPIGDTGRFTPTHLLISGIPSGSTQAVSYVASGYTGSVSAATTANLIALTNIPPMFYGDGFLVTGSALTTNSLTVTVIGTVFD